jgi:hypothetical protein
MAQPWETDWTGGVQTAAPPPAAPTARQPWDVPYDQTGNEAKPPMSTGDVGWDVAKSAAIGPVKGTIGLVGQGGDVGNLLSRGVEKLIDFIAPNKTPEQRKQLIDHFNDRLGLYTFMSPDMPTSADVRGGVEKVTGPLYDPKTSLGRVAQAPGEFLPAAALGPGSAARRVVGGAVIPGVSSELAGQALDDSGYGNYARIATALLTGGASAATVRPETAVAAIRQNLPQGVTAQMVDQAGALIQDGVARGVNLTWPEALSQVAGRPVLTNAQRLVESAPQSRGTMETFMGQRPAQVQQAVEQEAANIAPATNAPSMIGPQAAEAANSALDRVRGAINQATRPMYDAGRQHLVPPSVHAAMITDPVFQEALDAVRASPYWRREIGAQSDRSVAVYDAVKQELNRRQQNLAVPGTGDTSRYASAVAGQEAGNVRNVAIAAERQATQGPSSYEAALETQAALRQRYLTPLQEGPLGRIANAPTTQRAVEALFPSNALPGSAQEVSRAVSLLALENPQAARQLVGAHIRMQLDEAFNSAGRGQQGAQFAGATWAKNLVGNPAAPSARAENLQAAIEALPGGRGLWPGVERMLEITQATGTRQPQGSLTAFNERDLARLSTGGPVENLAKHGFSPGEWWHLAHDAIGKWQLGRNLNQIADIITDPRSAVTLRTLASVPPQSARAKAMLARLIVQNQAASGARGTEQIEAPKGQ